MAKKTETSGASNNVISQIEAKVINLDDFFTKDRQENGVWFEPEINGTGAGFELLVIGSESDEAAVIFADYEKDLNRIRSIEDSVKSNEESRRSMAKVASKLTKNIRGVDGAVVKLGDKEISFSEETMKIIFYNVPSLALEVARFARKDSNFMKK